MSHLCFQTYFKNSEGPWKAGINTVRRRNQENSPVFQPLFLGTAQPQSRKRVGYGPEVDPKKVQSSCFHNEYCQIMEVRLYCSTEEGGVAI